MKNTKRDIAVTRLGSDGTGALKKPGTPASPPKDIFSERGTSSQKQIQAPFSTSSSQNLS